MNTKTKELAGRIDNPFAKNEMKETGTGTALVESQAQATTQAMVVAAKRFPRDESEAMNGILDACTRQSLAQEALYQFPRGGSSVTGPSIRLAEVLAQKWGNMESGIIELSQAGGRSQMMAFCWDLQTNVRSQKVFMVDHVRGLKGGKTKVLTDPRDVYEMTANQGARRMRSCILSIIPRDVVEAAVDQVHLTLSNSMKAPAEEIAGLVKAFAEFGVSEAAIKKRLGKNFDAVTAAEVIRFRQIYRSIRDDMSAPDQWFELDAKTKDKQKTEGSSDLKERLRKGDDRPAIEPPGSEGETPPSVIRDTNGVEFDGELHVVNMQTGEIVFNKDGSFRKRPQKPIDHEEAGDPGPQDQDLI